MLDLNQLHFVPLTNALPNELITLLSKFAVCVFKLWVKIADSYRSLRGNAQLGVLYN